MHQSQQLTYQQLEHLATKLRDAWMRVLDAEQTARNYTPPQAWSYSTHSCHYEDEQTRIYACLNVVNRQLTKMHRLGGTH